MLRPANASGSAAKGRRASIPPQHSRETSCAAATPTSENETPRLAEMTGVAYPNVDLSQPGFALQLLIAGWSVESPGAPQRGALNPLEAPTVSQR